MVRSGVPVVGHGQIRALTAVENALFAAGDAVLAALLDVAAVDRRGRRGGAGAGAGVLGTLHALQIVALAVWSYDEVVQRYGDGQDVDVFQPIRMLCAVLTGIGVAESVSQSVGLVVVTVALGYVHGACTPAT